MKKEQFYRVKSYNSRLNRATVIHYSYSGDDKLEKDFEFYFFGSEFDVLCKTTADWDKVLKRGPYCLKEIFSPFWKQILLYEGF